MSKLSETFGRNYVMSQTSEIERAAAIAPGTKVLFCNATKTTAGTLGDLRAEFCVLLTDELAALLAGSGIAHREMLTLRQMVKKLQDAGHCWYVENEVRQMRTWGGY